MLKNHYTLRILKKMSKIDRQKVWEKYNGRCAYCGKEIALKDMQVDHIKPRRHGGDDSLDKWLDIQETIGAEQFLDCIWNWLGDTDLKAIVSYAIEDGYISDPAEEDDEDWDDDDF